MSDSLRPVPRSPQRRTAAHRESRLLDTFDREDEGREGGPLKRSTSSHTIAAANRHSMLATGRRASVRLDVSNFAAENFTPQLYLQSTMEADTEEALSAALKSLTAARDKSVSELKKAVWRNHGDFLAVGQEILDFELVMCELRSLMATLRTSAADLITSAGVASMVALEEGGAGGGAAAWAGSPAKDQRRGGPPSPPARTASPSAASSNPDWEGRRQKMLALTEVIQEFERHTLDESRYLILEGGGFHERVGSATTPRPIVLYLFNDALAMVSKRSRLAISASAKKWSLERFWPLAELEIVDVTEGKEAQNAIRVVRSSDTVLLLADTPSAKRLWLQQMIKAQRGGVSVSVGSSPTGSPPTPRSPLSTGAAEEAPDAEDVLQRRVSGLAPKRPGAAPPVSALDISPETIASMMALLDRLGEAIAICQYDSAVELVDKVKYELAQMDPRAPSHYYLEQKLRQQVSKLASFLNHAISDPIISRDAMSRHVQRLVVLGFPDEARENFLAARSDAIRTRLKHLRFVGDAAKTINDMGFVIFSSIATTADLYINSFKDHTMMAGFVFWVKLEIKNYVDMIVKQVFTDDLDFRIVGDCVAIARRHCASLRDVGLDLLFYLDDLFAPALNRLLSQHQAQLEDAMQGALKQEDFTVTMEVDNVRGITACTVKFYRAVLEALNDLEPLLQSEICDLLVSHLVSMLENYSTALLQASYNPQLSSAAQLTIIGDLQFLSGIFLPSLKEQLEVRFHRTFVALAKLYARLEAATGVLYKVFAENNSKAMIPDDLSGYSAGGRMDKDEADLSEWFSTMIPLYAKISRDADPERRTPMMRALLAALLHRLSERTAPQIIQFSQRGVQQFLLDLHFLLLVSSPWLDAELGARGAEAGQHAVEAYKQQESAPDTGPRQPDSLLPLEWYDARARQLLQQYPLDFGTTTTPSPKEL